MVLDVWADLQLVFATRLTDVYPGIQVSGLDRASQQYILQHLLRHVRDIEPMLEDIETGAELYPQTVSRIIDSLLSDHVDGMIWVETEIDRLVLPQLGFFAPSDERLIVHYIMGTWSPMTVIGLLEMLRWIDDLGEHIHIQMEEDSAPRILCSRFNKIWSAYISDKGTF